MKALSLYQPWASLLVTGHKKVETRGWPIRHRGPLLIHAAKKWNADLERGCLVNPFRAALEAVGVTMMDNPRWRVRPGDLVVGLPFGAIVGRVTVVACVETEKVTVSDDLDGANWRAEQPAVTIKVSPTERAFGDYRPGRFAWLCHFATAFPEPIPYRGMQGLFDVPDTLVAGLTAVA